MVSHLFSSSIAYLSILITRQCDEKSIWFARIFFILSLYLSCAFRYFIFGGILYSSFFIFRRLAFGANYSIMSNKRSIRFARNFFVSSLHLLCAFRYFISGGILYSSFSSSVAYLLGLNTRGNTKKFNYTARHNSTTL